MVRTRRDFTALTVSELMGLARDEGLSGYSHFRKSALLALLQAHFAKKPAARVVPRPEPRSRPGRRPGRRPKRRPKFKSRPTDSQVEEAVRTIRNAFAAGKKRIDVALFEPHQVAAVRRRLGKKAEIARFALNTRQTAVG